MEKVYCLHKEWDEVYRYISEKNLDKYLRYYHTLKFNGFMWNYSRISKTDQKLYFEELRKEFANNTIDNSILINHIPKYCQYGGLFAIKHNMKFILDFLLWLRSIVKG